MNSKVLSSKEKVSPIIWIFILLSTIVSLFIKFTYIDYTFTDYLFWLERWVKELQLGGITALKDPFYNYTPAYMYFLYVISLLDIHSLYAIKILSIFFEYVCAFYVGRLAFLYLKTEWSKWLPFAIVPLLPSIILNSAFMSQCDSIYVACILASIYYLFKNKQICAMILLGLAFSFKFQSVMVLPFYFIYLMRGQIKWYLFLIIPLIYICTIVPVALMGRNFFDLLFFYFTQVTSEGHMPLSLCFGNIYVWMHVSSEMFGIIKNIGYLFVGLSVLLSGYYLSNKKFTFTLKTWYTVLLLSVVFSCFFLPGMHERYMYLGDMAAVLYVLVNYKKIYSYLVGLSVVFVSYGGIIKCLLLNVDYEYSGFDFSYFNLFEYVKYKGLSILLFIVILYLFYDLYKVLSDKKEVELNSTY